MRVVLIGLMITGLSYGMDDAANQECNEDFEEMLREMANQACTDSEDDEPVDLRQPIDQTAVRAFATEYPPEYGLFLSACITSYVYASTKRRLLVSGEYIGFLDIESPNFYIRYHVSESEQWRLFLSDPNYYAPPQFELGTNPHFLHAPLPTDPEARRHHLNNQQILMRIAHAPPVTPRPTSPQSLRCLEEEFSTLSRSLPEQDRQNK